MRKQVGVVIVKGRSLLGSSTKADPFWPAKGPLRESDDKYKYSTQSARLKYAFAGIGHGERGDFWGMLLVHDRAGAVGHWRRNIKRR